MRRPGERSARIACSIDQRAVSGNAGEGSSPTIRLMPREQPVTPEELLTDSVLGRSVYARVRRAVSDLGDFQVRTTKSQIVFQRRRGFAYLWLPGTYLKHPRAEVVLSIALPRPVDSPRFKEVAHPSPRLWQHHLEIAASEDVDAEVKRWLEEAYASAA
jgi:hypothetical protein